jgi:RND family efflux transporter MFP subunit
MTMPGTSLPHGIALLGALLLLGGCAREQPQGKASKPLEVIVTKPITDEVTDYQDFTGRLNAFKTVEIRARVTGYVKEAPFKEGDVVHEGELLFQIDPRSYEADLKLAIAHVKVAQADRGVHQKNLGRAERLLRDRSSSQEEYDLAAANVEKDTASVEAMRASQERSKLYLDWTRVTAPLTGRISRRLVDPGNLITADTTVLTTIVAEDPAYVYFDVDERTYLDLKKSTTPAPSSSASDLQFPVLMRLANEDNYIHAGAVNFIDNQVNATTGTIRMRGVFQNPTGYLKSGLFARIRLPLGTPYQTVLIPDEALMSDQGRKYVYVLNDKNEVQYRRVKLGQAIRELRAVKEGLAEGERVIVSGMQRVRQGQQVEPKLQDSPQRPESPLGKLLTSNRSAAAAQKAVTQ